MWRVLKRDGARAVKSIKGTIEVYLREPKLDRFLAKTKKKRKDLSTHTYGRSVLLSSCVVSWWSFSFSFCLAPVAPLVLMAVLLLLLVLMFVVVEPLLTALQTKGLQPSAATGIVLTPFLLMMMMMIIVYEMLLSFVFRSSFSSTYCMDSLF